jgi:hypothetical protein
MISDIKTQLEEFNLAEPQLEQLKEILAEKKMAFEKENEGLLQNIKNISERQEQIKELAREEAIKEFQATGLKKLPFGLGIRVGTELLYDRDLALDWAKQHQICLKLDEKTFEKVALAQKIDFVVTQEKITATFPSKLILNEQ